MTKVTRVKLRPFFLLSLTYIPLSPKVKQTSHWTNAAWSSSGARPAVAGWVCLWRAETLASSSRLKQWLSSCILQWKWARVATSLPERREGRGFYSFWNLLCLRRWALFALGGCCYLFPFLPSNRGGGLTKASAPLVGVLLSRLHFLLLPASVWKAVSGISHSSLFEKTKQSPAALFGNKLTHEPDDPPPRSSSPGPCRNVSRGLMVQRPSVPPASCIDESAPL